MTSARTMILLIVLSTVSVSAQQSSFQDPLIDQLAGRWVIEGTIAGQESTHDLVAEWVLAHQYMRLHELSREKDSSGVALYEAIVFIGWDEPSQQYACLWLDVTGGGGLSAQGIGHAKRSGNQLPFVFRMNDGDLFHNTFVRDAETDTWRWIMDGEENGKRQPFARLTLRRK